MPKRERRQDHMECSVKTAEGEEKAGGRDRNKEQGQRTESTDRRGD